MQFPSRWSPRRGVHLDLTAAPPGVQQELVEDEPERFHRPKYVGPSGWVGVRVDRDVDRDEIDEMLREAYRLKAPRTLAHQLDHT